MTPTFTAFLFSAVVWLSDGSPQQPIARVEVTRAACEAAQAELAAEVATINAQSLPTMQLSFHVEPCKLIRNDSAAVPL